MGTFPHVLLGDVLLSIRAGVSVDGEARPLNDGEHGILTLSAVAAGRFDPTAFKAVTANGRRLGPSVSAGTLLMSRSNTEELVGTCAYVERDHPRLLLPDLLWEIRVRDDAPVVPRWLHAVLATEVMRKALVRSASGTSGSMKKISMGRLRRIAVPAPDLARQRKAVAWLDQVEAALERLQRLVEAKRRLKRALLQQLLAGTRRLRLHRDAKWRSDCLGDLATFTNGRAFRPTDWAATGRPIVRIQNLNGSKEFNYFQGEIEPRHAVENGDLLFGWSGSRGTSFGAHVWQGPSAVLNQHIFKVNARPSIDQSFLAHLLRWATARIERRAHGASALVHVTKPEIESFRVDLPDSKDCQRAITVVLDRFDHEIALLNRQLAAYRQLKRGLMQKLLTGDLAALLESNIATPAPSGSR
jgi:type I restriction enzyme S subunit